MATLCVAASSVALAACGSSDNSSSDSGGSAAAATTASTTAAVAGVPKPSTEQPTSIPLTEPLKSKPAPGKTMAVLYCPLPVCASYNPSFVEAAKAIGWHIKLIQYDLTAPQKAMQQAIDLGVDYIAIGGPPREAIAPQIKEAAAKGIATIGTGSTGTRDTSVKWYPQVNQGPTASAAMKNLGDWVINDAKGNADAVVFGAFEYPLQTASYQGIEASFKACPDCKLAKQPLTTAQTGGGGVPSAVVSYLQSHPSTNYVVFAFADAFTGVASALKAAGLDKKVKVVVDENTSPAVTQALQNGTIAASNNQPLYYTGWATVDAAARLSEGMTPPDTSDPEALMPFWLQDSPEAAKQLAPSNLYYGPKGYQDQFKKLWHVG
jgi:ribose transport system substrate-binding protein